MEPSVLRFLAFLGIGFLFVLATILTLLPVGLLTMKAGRIRGRYILLAQVSFALVSSFFLVAFLKVLTGKGHFFFLWLFIATILLMALAEFLWLIFGARNVPWAARQIWMAREFELLNPKLEKSLGVLSLIVMLAYPIYIGVGYFGTAFTSATWPEHVLRATLIILVGSGFFIMLPKQMYILLSRNLMEGTRSRIFIAQLTNSVSLLMTASLFVWTLDPQAVDVSIAGTGLSFRPKLFYTLVGYVVLVLIIPYLVGHFRNKEWTARLSDARAAIYKSLSSGIRSARLDTASNTLISVRAQIADEVAELEAERSYQLLSRLRDEEVGEFDIYKEAATQSAERDPRFFHGSRLSQLSGQLDDSIAELSTKDEDDEKWKVLKRLGDWMDHRKAEQQERVSGKAWVMVAITALITALMNPLLTGIGKMFASQLGFAPS